MRTTALLFLIGGLLIFPARLAAQTPAVTLSPQPETTAAAGLTVTTVTTTNIRAEADTRAAIVGRAAAGAAVTVAGRDQTGRWLYITEPEAGWLPVFAVDLPSRDALALPVYDPAAGDAAADAPTATAYGVVNVRAEPAITGAIVGQLALGESAVITGRSSAASDWLLIEVPGVASPLLAEPLTGWVAYFTVRVSGRLDGLPILGADSGGQVIVPAEQIARAVFNVRLREEPSTAAPTLRVVPFGAEVAPIARSADGDWLYLSYDGAFGWGATELFALTEAGFAALPVYAVEATPTPTASPTPRP